MNKLIITFALAALAFGAVADETGGTRGRGRRQPNPEAKLHRFSTTVEKERPKLNQETKDLIAAYRRDPSDANRAALRRQVAANYDAVVARKKAKLEDLKRTAKHRSKVEEMQVIVDEMLCDREQRIEASMARFTDSRFRPGLRDGTAAYRPVLGAQGRNVSIGATPVTEADWAKFAGTSVSPEKTRLPVVGISVAKSNISYHLKNIFETGELERDRTVQKIRTVQYEGGRSVSRSTDFFNLEVVISLGFRINSRLGIQFRRWANDVLRQYMAYGIAVSNPQTTALAGKSIPAYWRPLRKERYRQFRPPI